MKNSTNKIVAAAVCGVIVGAVGTSIIGNFQSKVDTNSASGNGQTEKPQVPNNTEIEGERPERQEGGKGNHHQGEANLDTTEGVDVSSGNYNDGTYEGTASGYATGLKVEVTISNGNIDDVQVVSHNETPGFCERAIESVTAEIVSNQSTAVDTISGATYTSIGIINAVNEALSTAE